MGNTLTLNTTVQVTAGRDGALAQRFERANDVLTAAVKRHPGGSQVATDRGWTVLVEARHVAEQQLALAGFIAAVTQRCRHRATTAPLVGSSTQSKRRRTVIRSITRSYCGGRYGPRSRSATAQIKFESSWKEAGIDQQRVSAPWPAAAAGGAVGASRRDA